MEDRQTSGLAIVSGTGRLPRLLAEECRDSGRLYRVVVFDGISLNWVNDHPVVAQPIEKLGKLFKNLKREGCGSVCFAGKIERPHFNPAKLDLQGMKLAGSVLSGNLRGDDAVLREVLQTFERQGFRIEAAQEVLPALLPEAGVLTKKQPSERDSEDAKRAAELATALGALDVGQGAVVAQGLCLGLETLPGTQRMLEFVADTRAESGPNPKNGRGVFYKGPKPQQDRRADLPAIGPDTMRQAHAAGLAGVAIAANGVLVIGLQETLAEADRLGLFLWCRATE